MKKEQIIKELIAISPKVSGWMKENVSLHIRLAKNISAAGLAECLADAKKEAA